MPLKTRVVYAITERSGKIYMRRIGAGHENPDGSLDLRLEALPTDGCIHVRTFVPAPASKKPVLRLTRASRDAPWRRS